jgi:hypothetical protein
MSWSFASWHTTDEHRNRGDCRPQDADDFQDPEDAGRARSRSRRRSPPMQGASRSVGGSGALFTPVVNATGVPGSATRNHGHGGRLGVGKAGAKWRRRLAILLGAAQGVAGPGAVLGVLPAISSGSFLRCDCTVISPKAEPLFPEPWGLCCVCIVPAEHFELFGYCDVLTLPIIFFS